MKCTCPNAILQLPLYHHALTLHDEITETTYRSLAFIKEIEENSNAFSKLSTHC